MRMTRVLILLAILLSSCAGHPPFNNNAIWKAAVAGRMT